MNKAYIMAKCSAIAYLSGKKAKAEYKKLGFTGHKYFNIKGAQCHTVGDKDYLILAFRGTEVKSWSDIKADLNVDSVTAKYSYGKVHKGFEKEVDKLWPEIKDHVITGLKPAGRELIVTGHSLGASMATIAIARFYKLQVSLDALYTYGSPRVGNKSFKKKLRVQHYRYVNNSDDVTKMPFYHWGYRHHGELMYINSKGAVKVGTNKLKRFKDRLKGRLDGLKEKDYFDGLSDHSIDQYIKHLIKL